jgi:hypothetical protein
VLADAQGRLDDELDRLQRIALLIFDEVSNKRSSVWGEFFGDDVTAAAPTRPSPQADVRDHARCNDCPRYDMHLVAPVAQRRAALRGGPPVG